MKSFCSRVRHSQSLLAAVLASSAVFTAGCANMATTAGGSSLSNNVATIGGRIHGGNQPVAFATVQLWFAGQGLPASVVAQTTSASDGTGSFGFVRGIDGGANAGISGNTFSCPSSSVNPLVYVTATGGNTQNTGDINVNNTAAVFVAPFGLCKNITPSSFVYMTEVTTVATMAVWQQYFNPQTTSTSSSTGLAFTTDGTGLSFVAMNNNYDLIPNLVNLANGTAVTSLTIAGASPGGGVGAIGTSVTATPETEKINTIANILAACINSPSATSTACTTLFANATPGDPTTTAQPAGTTFPVATNTLQAAYYMLTNPTNGSATRLTNLFALSPALGAAFQPTLANAPSDWTIAINYSSTSTCGALTNPGHLINSAQDLAIDAVGGVWIANGETSGNLSYLTHTGAPGTCVQVGSGPLTGIAIDYVVAGLPHIWLADSNSFNVYRYAPATAAATPFPTATPPASIAADGDGNVYFTTPAGAGTLYEIPGGATAPVPIFPATAGVSIATAIGTGPKVVVDGAPSVWTTSGSTFITRSSSATPDTGLGYSSSQFTTGGPTYGLSASPITNIPPPQNGTKSYVFIDADGTSNSMSLLQGSGNSYTLASGWPATGFSTPAAIASDGAQNIWTINNGVGANSLVEVGLGQQQLSPSNGFQKDASYLAKGRSLVIDSSGNVWVGLDGSNSITEIVGAAVPVYQPYALGLHNGQFQRIP